MTFFIESELDALIAREGGYVDHPNDKGGPTCWGITQATALANGYTDDMRLLPKTLAKDIYRKRFWTAPAFDKIAAMGLGRLAGELFDTGVNMGQKTQVVWLQRWLNALCGQWDKYVHIGVDGDAGQGTRGAITYLVNKRGLDVADAALTKAVNCSQGARYLELVEAREANNSFVWGWLMNRVSL